MTSVLPRTAPAPTRPAGWRHLLVRLHFYAGVLVAPFLLVAALTGLAYTVAPQVDRVLYSAELRTAAPVTTELPVTQQVAAAQAALPGLAISSVALPEGDRATTQVVFDDPALTDDRQRTVYVDPGNGDVRGQLVTWFGYTPAVTMLDDLHRNLLLGDVGRHYSEIAASWLWVVAAGGVVLWLGRQRDRQRGRQRVRRALLPDLSASGRRRTLSWHGSTGLLLVVGLVFLSITGLTWSRYAGERFEALLTAAGATAPELMTVLPGGTAASSSLADADRVVDSARAAGLDGPVKVKPSLEGAAWSVTQTDGRWPVRKDAVAVDPASGAVTATTRFAERPVLSKVSSLGIDAHMGRLLGPANQLLLAALALGLVCVIAWGYRAWWQRRPKGRAMGRLPRRGAWRQVPVPAILVGAAVVIGVGWALPWLGVTLAGFLVLDLLLGLMTRRRPGPAEPERVESEQDAVEELLV